MQPELMDDPDVDPAALRRALGYIRRVNRLLGYNRHVVAAVETFGRNLSVLDVATGSADLPQRLARRGHEAAGLDLHATTLAVAAEWAPGVPLVRGDAFALPVADGAVDVATCAMSLHHFDHDDQRRVVAELRRVARRGVVVADLLHTRFNTAGAWLTTLAADPMNRHDARLSVRQAMTWPAARALAADVAGKARRTLSSRFVITIRA